MAQPRLTASIRGIINSALTGIRGSKRALARRLELPNGTITRVFQQWGVGTDAIEPTAQVVLEALAMLLEMGHPDVLEEVLQDCGVRAHVRLELEDDDSNGTCTEVQLDTLSLTAACGQVARMVGDAVQDGRIDREERRELKEALRLLDETRERLVRRVEQVAEDGDR